MTDKKNLTQKERMVQGLWYDANYDPDLLQERDRADSLCFALNQCPPCEQDRRKQLLEQLMGNLGKNAVILSPLYADYGYRTSIGDDVFINHGCYLMDGGGITIGSHCFLGPNCGLYTANHPLLVQERNAGYELASPIHIEDNVWIGADVTILPGVTIGKGSVIGAKSLVTRDIPAGMLAVGSPCRPLRVITQEDSIAALLQEDASALQTGDGCTDR